MRTLIAIGLALSLTVTQFCGVAAAQMRAGRGGPNPIPPGSLTSAEIRHIIYMREEEKLARDVYLTLAARWKVPILANIAKSEATHMAAIKQLIVKYRLQDPVQNDAVGAFTNPVFTQAYQQAVADGSVSLVAACRVGVFIEQTDIADLTAALLDAKQADVRTVFQNLLRGSQSHLMAFQSYLK